MIDKVLRLGGEGLLVPVIVAVTGAVVVKGLFTLHQSRSANRRDFLAFWSPVDERDDVWLEVAVRHLFGEYVPAKIIRALLMSPNPARALLDVSNAWPLLRLSEAGEIQWKAARHASPRNRRRERWFLAILYFFFAGAGFLLAFECLVANWSLQSSLMAWLYVFIFLLSAYFVLSKESELAGANLSVPRWLGLE